VYEAVLNPGLENIMQTKILYDEKLSLGKVFIEEHFRRGESSEDNVGRGNFGE
jgi:hypothetical protein